jgi:hypothetical protein
MFGDQYKGDVAPTPTPAPETSEAPAPKGEPEPTEEEIIEGEPDETGEEPETETAPADTGEMPIATVSELVEHLEENLGGELPPNWFDTLKMSFNVDGMPTEATIKELVDSYQLRGAAEHRFETAKAIAQKESETWAAKQQQLDGQFNVLAELIQAQEASLERDVRAIDPSLRETDPAEWGARQLEFGQRHAQITQAKANAIARYNANAEAQKTDADTRRARIEAEQNEVLLQKLPEWREPQKAQQEKVQIADYLMRQGFTPTDLSNLLDHRQVLMARKAMLYDQTRGQADAAKKRVAVVPKVMKPGAPKAQEQIASDRINALKAKMEKSGSFDDALAYRLATKRGASR